VTTKYNPARTWTAENSVGIGGSYMCVYGMEGPGGYQFIGRTLQMWNRYQQTDAFDKPWLLRFFDQIRFYEVTSEELKQIRRDFPKGNYPIRIEQTTFDLDKHNAFIEENRNSIEQFKQHRQHAFEAELQHWKDNGLLHFDSETASEDEALEVDELAENCISVDSPRNCNIWKVEVEPEQQVKEGDVLVILEAMKMEISVTATQDGTVKSIQRSAGSQVKAGERLLILEELA
jgi:urea carboxylase